MKTNNCRIESKSGFHSLISRFCSRKCLYAESGQTIARAVFCWKSSVYDLAILTTMMHAACPTSNADLCDPIGSMWRIISYAVELCVMCSCARFYSRLTVLLSYWLVSIIRHSNQMRFREAHANFFFFKPFGVGIYRKIFQFPGFVSIRELWIFSFYLIWTKI